MTFPRTDRRWILLLACVLTLAAARPVQVEDLVRQANQLLEAGQVDEAETLYLQAEERAADPGLIAFNKGLLLASKGEHRKAELSFRRTLGDGEIPPARRTQALYNLGNALVRQAGDIDIKQLQAAIDCYERCLRETTDTGLTNDASHNLEVAKILWAKAKARRPPGERDPEFEEPDPREVPPDPRKQPDSKDGDGKDPKLQPENKFELNKGKDKGALPKEVEKQAPGKGNLPVVPDTDEVPEMSPEDAREALRRGVLRMERERQKLREESATGERPRANDW